jgi:hypothetical protein
MVLDVAAEAYKVPHSQAGLMVLRYRLQSDT